jgi:RNA polymerase sigma-70 factor (ECF subfamily)
MYLSVEILPRPATPPASSTGTALPDLDFVYSFLYSRVGNRSDAEDLTQEVALKAFPRLRADVPDAAVKSYLYATARSVLATFWSRRLRLPESELPDDLQATGQSSGPEPSTWSAARVREVLNALPPNHRQLLELRFLQGYSLREVAVQMGKTEGSVKVMQLRALRKAAQLAL